MGLVELSKIFDTLRTDGGQGFSLAVEAGVEKLYLSWAPDDTFELRTLSSWDIGLSTIRPSPSPKRALLLSMAWLNPHQI